jgi:hypothetical protein
MSAPQFALHDAKDFYAVCLTCKKKHLIARGEEIQPQPWLDWLTKHPAESGCHTLVAMDAHALLDDLSHNADAKVAYVASADYTITLTGLASDTSLLAGREGSSLSNASNKYLDEIVSGKITNGTTITANRLIEVHAVFALDDTPNWPDVFDGTDSAETIGATADGASIKPMICAPVAIMPTVTTTSDVTRPFMGRGLRQYVGDGMMPAHVPFVTHSTGANLNATASNHKITHTGVYATVV